MERRKSSWLNKRTTSLPGPVTVQPARCWQTEHNGIFFSSLRQETPLSVSGAEKLQRLESFTLPSRYPPQQELWCPIYWSGRDGSLPQGHSLIALGVKVLSKFKGQVYESMLLGRLAPYPQRPKTGVCRRSHWEREGISRVEWIERAMGLKMIKIQYIFKNCYWNTLLCVTICL